ncbi:MAG: hypothetical protein R6W82_09670 [bacterium]
MLTIQISLVVIALSTLVLAGFILALLLGLLQGVRQGVRLLQEFREEFGPLAEEMRITLGHANEVAGRAAEEVEGFTETVSGVRRRTERLGALVEVLEEDLEKATVKMVSLVGAVAGLAGSVKRRRDRKKRAD